MLKVISGDVIHRTHTLLLIFAPPCPTTACNNKWISLQQSTQDLVRGKFYRPALLWIFSLRVENRTDQTNPAGLTGSSYNAEGSGMLTHQCVLLVNT